MFAFEQEGVVPDTVTLSKRARVDTCRLRLPLPTSVCVMGFMRGPLFEGVQPRADAP